MSSNRRKIASRANGAQSRRPITPAGKIRSTRNATRHGLMAKCVVLDNESKEGFDTLPAGFVERFAPADMVELGLAEEMFSALARRTGDVLEGSWRRRKPTHTKRTRQTVRNNGSHI